MATAMAMTENRGNHTQGASMHVLLSVCVTSASTWDATDSNKSLQSNPTHSCPPMVPSQNDQTSLLTIG